MGTPAGGYFNAAGEKVPSVTSVISKSDDKSALIKWGYRIGLEHGALRAKGLPCPNDLYDVSQKAADAGSIAHDLIEHSILYGTDPTAEELEQHELWSKASEDTREKARNCYRQYKRWRKQTSIEIVQTEKGGVSELYQYGGTYDGLGRNSDGELVLIDWKTSGGVYASYLIQLSAYDQINFEKTGERVKEFHLLRMDKENADFKHHSWLDLSEGFEAFKHMRALYDLTYRLSRRAR